MSQGKTNRPPLASIMGKLPPQAIDLEKMVLGACLDHQEAFLIVADILKKDMFHVEAHKIVFEALSNLSLASIPLDVQTCVTELKKAGKLEQVGGAFYITELCDNLTNLHSVEHNARIIAQKYMQRALIVVSSETIDLCYNETSDVFDVLEAYETKRDEIIGQIVVRKEVENYAAMQGVFAEMRRRASFHDMDVTGIPTALTRLNACTAGWQNSNVIIVGARPAMGKTAFMLSNILTAARRGDPVGVFSLEMSTEKLVERLISSATEIELHKIKKTSLMEDHEWHRLDRFTHELESYPIVWDDTASMNIIELAAKAKRMKRRHGIKMLFIDYLQLISPVSKRGTREQEISEISRAIKILSKTLDIPIMALSQLSRDCEKRPGISKRPQLSDLRESGSIEQDADIVMFLFRPEYYGIDEDEDGNSTVGISEVIVAKNRDGETDLIPGRFIGKFTKFVDPIEYFEGFSTPTQDNVISLPSNDLSGHRSFNDSPDLGGDDDLPF